VVNKKLDTVQCSDEEKVIFAAHQLQGPASLWWDHFQATQPEGQPITWARFTAAFRRTHVPAGVVALKKKEFRELKQDGRTVTEFLHEFNRLARYAPKDVRTDEEKQEKFLEGLNDELSVQLISGEYEDFQKLVDKAIRLEDKHRKMESKKRKLANARMFQGPSQKPRYVFPPQVGSSSAAQRASCPQMNNKLQNSGWNNGQRSTPAQGGSTRKDSSGKILVCYNCYEPGHFADKCPKPKRPQAPAPARNANQSNNGNRNNNNLVRGRVNHVSAEEAQAAPEVILGTFLVNSVHACVLFDSGATHSFISRDFVAKHQIRIEDLSNPMIISTPGSQLPTKLFSPSVTIEIQGVTFLANLILLSSKNPDVILGMNWLTKHSGIIDCAIRSISLIGGTGQRVTFHAKLALPCKQVLNQVSMEEIPIVKEYPDVFPEELPGMPPKRDIEFRMT
jgi:hypothetical protein